MFDFLKRLVSGGSASTEPETTVVYDDFTIQPTPQKGDAGWQVRAIITKEIDGEVRTHTFIRADAFADKAETVNTIIRKAKRTIDEQGERIFQR